MRAAVLAFAAALAAFRAFGDLVKVDADGVTEVGGSPAYSRMLPRTGATGRLDASLLPPVADWASTPVPGLYYVAIGAETGGNGAPQHPFRAISEAVEQARLEKGPQTVVILGAGTYQETIRPYGTLVVMGAGPATTLRLVLEVDGTGPTVSLCNVHADSLELGGGNLTLELLGTTVGSLSGGSTGLTVRRRDMGSRVNSATFAYTDVYDGHPTAPKALELASEDATPSMRLSDGRATVGQKAVAYLDDVSAATSAVYSAVGEIAGDYAGLGKRLSEEEDARKSGDSGLYAALSNTTAELEGRIGKVGDGWNSQLESLSSRIDASNTAVSALEAQEAADMASLTEEIAATKTAYAAADDEMATRLRSEFKSGMEATEGSVVGTADSRFALLLTNATPGIVDQAVAKMNESGGSGGLTNRLLRVETDVGALRRTAQSNALDIATLKLRDTALEQSIGNASTTHSTDVSALNGRIDALSTAMNDGDAKLGTRVTSVETDNTTQGNDITALKSKVNEVIDCLTKIKAGETASMTVPGRLQ